MADFDPKKIIDFNKDYYNLLDLKKDDFPKGNSRQVKIDTTRLLEKAFRVKARTCHPDFGGSNEAFLDIVRARRILEDPMLKKIYDQGYFEEFSADVSLGGFEVDWSKIGTYRKGTPEDTVGYSLFLKIAELKSTLEIVPAFIPEDNQHNYEWDFVIKSDAKKIEKLVISIVNDENEVLRLTDSSKVEESLPFKIYISIPKVGLVFARQSNKELNPMGNVMINGAIQSAQYTDIDLLETTILETAHKYIENKLQEDLVSYRNGSLKTNTVAKETKWLDSEKLKSFDREKLSEILNMKSYTSANIENAADFIENLPD